jgi:hypothetical protein
LKGRQGVEGKRKKLKRRQGDEGQTIRSREEKSRREFIHPTFQPKPKNLLEAIFAKSLTLLNNLEDHINL